MLGLWNYRAPDIQSRPHDSVTTDISDEGVPLGMRRESVSTPPHTRRTSIDLDCALYRFAHAASLKGGYLSVTNNIE